MRAQNSCLATLPVSGCVFAAPVPLSLEDRAPASVWAAVLLAVLRVKFDDKLDSNGDGDALENKSDEGVG